jgi:hypothetical protein
MARSIDDFAGLSDQPGQDVGEAGADIEQNGDQPQFALYAFGLRWVGLPATQI